MAAREHVLITPIEGAMRGRQAEEDLEGRANILQLIMPSGLATRRRLGLGICAYDVPAAQINSIGLAVA
eukprot:4890890-Alexandrium_andersonii.AAC.1